MPSRTDDESVCTDAAVVCCSRTDDAVDDAVISTDTVAISSRTDGAVLWKDAAIVYEIRTDDEVDGSARAAVEGQGTTRGMMVCGWRWNEIGVCESLRP